MCKKFVYLTLFFALVSGLAGEQAWGQHRAAYYDERYRTSWAVMPVPELVRDAFEDVGYEILDADQLKTWMDARMADGAPSVVVFCRDNAPDTVVESNSSNCTLRKYLDAGGKVVFYGDIPFWDIGHSDGTWENYGGSGCANILDIPGVDWTNHTDTEVTITAKGTEWGLTETWTSNRWTPCGPTFTVLATDASGNAAAWVKHFVRGDTVGGFVRIWDCFVFTWSLPNVDDLIRVAEYGMAGNPYAHRPNPPDGALHTDSWVTLSWSPGISAISHDVYFGDDRNNVNTGTGGTFKGNQTETRFSVGSVRSPYLVPGTTYYWRIDEVEADGTTIHKGDVWSFSVPPQKAYNPNPSDGARFIAVDITLSWVAGLNAKLHYVYFGDDRDVVANATGAPPQAATIYDPGPLKLDTTYYWRVDEFDGATAHTGNVWSFTTLPETPITDPSLVGWWKFDEGMDNVALDWSGHGNHGALRGDPTYVAGVFGQAISLDGYGDYVDCGNPPEFDITDFITFAYWIKVVEFDKGWNTVLSKGDDSWRSSRAGWNNFMEAAVTGTTGDYTYGVTPVDDGQWHHVGFVYDGRRNYLYVDGELDASEPSTGKINVSRYPLWIGGNAQWPGGWWNGLIDDVRIYNRALSQEDVQIIMQGSTGEHPQASSPTPADGDTHAYTWVNLSWRAGDFAVSHDVYFGENFDDVNDGTEGTFRGNQAETFFVVGLPGYSYPSGLVPDTTYYWRIDEVNDLHPDSPWKGDVWSFSIPSNTAHTPKHFEITYYDNYNYDTDQWDAWQSDATPRDAWDDKYLADDSSGRTVYTDHAFTSIAVFNLRGGFFSKDGHASGGEDWNPLRSLGDNVSEQSAHHVFAALFKGLIYLDEGDVLWVASDDDVYIFLDDDTKWGQEVLSVPYISNFSSDSMTVTAAQAGYHMMTVKYIERRNIHSGIEITRNGEHLQSAEVGTATNLGSIVNSAYWEASPSISADGLALFFDSDRPAGSGERDLYVTTRATKDDDWGRPVNLGQPVNTPSYDGQPGISADGRALYFSSDRPGGFGNQDLWVTTRPTTDDEWGTPVNPGSTVNSSAHDTEPSISADGLTLFFDSDRAGGYGSWDIWMVTRASTDGRWRTPVPLPPPVNGAFSEGEPSISADGRTLYFCSNRPGGYGTFDLWVATRETTDDEWGTPVNLGPIVNTTYHDWGPSISADGSTLYFTGEHVRNLCQNDYDLWQVSLRW